jgi:hypothetical protein
MPSSQQGPTSISSNPDVIEMLPNIHEQQEHRDQAHSIEITRLEDISVTKEARINELEEALREHQAPTGDIASTGQVETAEESNAPIALDKESSEFIEECCYCLCEEYGDMVACDNLQCERKWFHLNHTDLQTLPSEEERWVCTLCRGWEAKPDIDDNCWRCPVCLVEVLGDDENHDEGQCPEHAPMACHMCELERGDSWQFHVFESATDDSEEDEGESDGESGDDAVDDLIEYDSDFEDAEMDYDDTEGNDEGSEGSEGSEDDEKDESVEHKEL